MKLDFDVKEIERDEFGNAILISYGGIKVWVCKDNIFNINKQDENDNEEFRLEFEIRHLLNIISKLIE